MSFSSSHRFSLSVSLGWHLWNVSAQKCVKGVYKIKIVQNKSRKRREREREKKCSQGEKEKPALFLSEIGADIQPHKRASHRCLEKSELSQETKKIGAH